MPKILVIDDKQDNLISLSALLKSLISDTVVLTSGSGKEGIEKAKAELPDTILLDIIMPGMDGFEVCRRLKSDEKTRHIPVIMLTALKTDFQSRVKALGLGADAFLSKPVEGAELSAQIKAMLRIKYNEDALKKQEELLRESHMNLEKKIAERTSELMKANQELELEIEERKRVEDELRKSEEKYHGMIQNLMEAFYSTTLEGKLLDYNTEFVRMLRLDPNKDHAGIELPDFWQDPEDRKDYIEEFMRNGFIKNYIVNSKKSDGEKIVVQINSRLIKDGEGRPSGIEGTFLDITKRKQAEAELEKHQKHLETLVKEQTNKLEEKLAELERMNDLFVGREFRIKDLRNRVKELELKIVKIDY